MRFHHLLLACCKRDFWTMSKDKITFPTGLITIVFINNFKYLDVEYGLIPAHLNLKTCWMPVFRSLCFSCWLFGGLLPWEKGRIMFSIRFKWMYSPIAYPEFITAFTYKLLCGNWRWKIRQCTAGSRSGAGKKCSSRKNARINFSEANLCLIYLYKLKMS